MQNKCRKCEKGFMPSPGKITELYVPGGPNVRVDSAVYSGYNIPPYYDSMIAKLIVYGKDREEAICRMRRALGEFIIEGVNTNIDFQFELISSDEFINGTYDTSFIEKVLNTDKILSIVMNNKQSLFLQCFTI